MADAVHGVVEHGIGSLRAEAFLKIAIESVDFADGKRQRIETGVNLRSRRVLLAVMLVPKLREKELEVVVRMHRVLCRWRYRWPCAAAVLRSSNRRTPARHSG